MSELDLERLEDKATQWPGTEFSRDVLDLIQRLREAEAETKIADEQYRLASEGWQARIAQLERVREAAAELKDALTQIGLQMSPDSTTEETVRTGVRTFEATEHYFDRLFDALAAVEEPSPR